MLGRTIFAATFLALAQFTIASPPGCLLGAVNEYEDPANVKSVCKAKDLSSKVAEFCGDDAEAAIDALKDICNDVDVEVSTKVSASASGHASASGNATGSGYATASGSSYKPTGTAGSTLVPYPTGSGSGSGSGNSTVPIATGGPKPSGSATGTAGLPESTGAAGKMEIGVAAIVAGLMAIAL